MGYGICSTVGHYQSPTNSVDSVPKITQLTGSPRQKSRYISFEALTRKEPT